MIVSTFALLGIDSGFTAMQASMAGFGRKFCKFHSQAKQALYSGCTGFAGFASKCRLCKLMQASQAFQRLRRLRKLRRLRSFPASAGISGRLHYAEASLVAGFTSRRLCRLKDFAGLTAFVSFNDGL